MTSLSVILYSFAFVLFIFFEFCYDKKKLLYLIYVIFQHNCTYLTFDLSVTLNRKITFVIHPYTVCNSLRNNSSLDAEHSQKMPSGVLVGIRGGRLTGLPHYNTPLYNMDFNKTGSCLGS